MHYSNLLNGVVSEDGDIFKVFSPIDNSLIGTGLALPGDKLKEVFKNTNPINKDLLTEEQFAKLASLIKDNKQEFTNQLILETGYTTQDCIDIVDGSIEFVTHFLKNIAETKVTIPSSTFSYEHSTGRKLKIVPLSEGVVSIMTPQNAPLILELTALLNALAAGNGILLRPSSQNVGTASKLIELLIEVFPQEVMKSISIVSCKAPVFLELSYQYSNMIHYIGSSFHGKKILQDAIETRCKVLVDGEGSSTVVIDKTANLEEAINACRDGIIRCSGELCSTVRTILVHKELYPEFIEQLKNEIEKIVIGDPRDEKTTMGPLFHEKQVENIRQIAGKYKVITNVDKNIKNPNYMRPILCELTHGDVSFVNEEFYGPLVGVASYEGDDWKKWLGAIRYKLNSCIFSKDNEFIESFIKESGSPRVVVNHDPSIESVFEPWGAFLPSGQNDVSYWLTKYQKYIQIDTAVSYENK